MRWQKLGSIFDPTQHTLTNNCSAFAQGPQALVFDTFVRIYFSTREKDKTGQYLSHIAFVDIDKAFRHVIGISQTPVIELGQLGAFDEHGIFPLNVVRDTDRILGYISGWSRRVSVSVETSIGLAISNDNGITFKRVGPGPVLTSSLQEPFLVGDPFVLNIDGAYHMWYIYGTRWINDQATNIRERVYKIGHATSHNGASWVKEGRQLITDRLNSDECQALPTVIKHGDRYHMYFCYRKAIGFRERRDSAYRIGYASSVDLISWARNDDDAGIDVSPNGWDCDMLCYPHVFRCDDSVYMLYNGNAFGRFGFGIAVLQDK